MALLNSAWLGLLGWHIGLRKLRDEAGPPASWGGALLALAWAGVNVAMIVSSELVRTSYGWFHHGPDPAYIVRQAFSLGTLVTFLSIPITVLLAMAVGRTGDALKSHHLEARLRGENSPIRLDVCKLALLALLPVLSAVSATFFTPNVAAHFDLTYLGTRWLAFVPHIWFGVTLALVVQLWLLSNRRGWQWLLTLLTGVGLGVITTVYSVIVGETEIVQWVDISIDSDARHGIKLGLLVIAALLAFTVVLSVLVLRQLAKLREQTDYLTATCSTPVKARTQRLQWPDPCTEPEESLAFSVQTNGQSRLMWLEGNTLRFADDMIDLERPFIVEVAASPQVEDDTTIVSIEVRQIDEERNAHRIVVAFHSHHDAVPENLPRLERGGLLLVTEDVTAFMNAIAYHADVAGVELPTLDG